MKSALERRLAGTDDVRRLLRREALDVTQDDGRPPLVGELGQRPLEGLPELVVERLGFRTELRRLGQRDDRVIAIWIELDDGGGRRERRRWASLNAIRYSQVDNCARSLNRDKPRQARRNTSCATSSASLASSPKRRNAPTTRSA